MIDLLKEENFLECSMLLEWVVDAANTDPWYVSSFKKSDVIATREGFALFRCMEGGHEFKGERYQLVTWHRTSATGFLVASVATLRMAVNGPMELVLDWQTLSDVENLLKDPNKVHNFYCSKWSTLWKVEAQ